MKLYKCDRCGNLFENIGFSIDVGFVGDAGFNDIAKYYKNDYRTTHFCISCFDRFRRFKREIMDMKEDKKC